MSGLVDIGDIVAARDRLGAVVRPTRAVRSDSLSAIARRPVFLKPEYGQRTGSFKIRGAYNFIAQLPDAVPVVAASAGNHAQGVALAAALTGRTSRIYMPRLASLPKIAATRGYGGDVIPTQGGVEECIAAARADAANTGAVLVPPFDDPQVICGQGTIGLEIADEVADVGTVVVPIGGGGLISGVAAALAAVRPAVRVVGVEAVGAASMSASVAAGHPVGVTPATMADGVALRVPAALTLEHVRAHVDAIVQVGEEDISGAVVMLLERAKAVVEPSGALSLAAVLSGAVGGDDPVVIVASGGNVDPLLLARLIDHGLSAAGRFLVIGVVVGDHPGALHDLTGIVAEQGANLLTVEHRREGMRLPVGSVSVTLTIETRDHDHQGEILAALGDAGYEARRQD